MLPVLKKPLLTEKQRETRLSWIRNHQGQDWKKVIFSDEKTFFFMKQGRLLVRRYSNETVVRPTVKHPPKLYIWGCFCYSHFINLTIFNYTLTGIGYVKILRRGLLPYLRSHPRKHYIFQEDNDSKHQSRIATTIKSQNGIRVLDWPQILRT